MTNSDVWKKSLESIKGQIPNQHFNTWFKPIVVTGINETSLELEVPNRFFLEWLKDHYLSLIQEAVTKVSQREYYRMAYRESDGPASFYNAFASSSAYADSSCRKGYYKYSA